GFAASLGADADGDAGAIGKRHAPIAPFRRAANFRRFREADAVELAPAADEREPRGKRLVLAAEHGLARRDRAAAGNLAGLAPSDLALERDRDRSCPPAGNAVLAGELRGDLGMR